MTCPHSLLVGRKGGEEEKTLKIWQEKEWLCMDEKEGGKKSEQRLGEMMLINGNGSSRITVRNDMGKGGKG